MMRDFSFTAYDRLLSSLKDNPTGLRLLSECSSTNVGIFLRHDVDRKPAKSLIMGKMESSHGIVSTYYFRDVPESYDPEIMDSLTSLGHEIGYHYESLSLAAKELSVSKHVLRNVNLLLKPILTERLSNPTSSMEKDIFKEFDESTRRVVIKFFNRARDLFEASLSKFRTYWDIKTVVMHGRPEVPIDNRLLWLVFDYRDYGIKVEPYFDIDYTRFLYITDAGRSWSDASANQRDKVIGVQAQFHHIEEIIGYFETSARDVVLSIHPEHWTDNHLEWHKIRCSRMLKNHIKKVILSNKG